MKKILLIFCLFLLPNLLFATVEFGEFLVDGRDYTEKTNQQNPDIQLNLRDPVYGIFTSTWTYQISTDGGNSWSAWFTVDAVDISGGVNHGETISYSTTTFNFPSSLTQNMIKILVTNNNLEEYTTSYVIKVDTIAPLNVINFTELEATEDKQLKVRWREQGDLPVSQDIDSYKIYYSTTPEGVMSLEDWGLVASTSSLIASGSGADVEVTVDVLLAETIYYFSVRTFDGFYYSEFLDPVAVLSSGIKAPSNFTGVASSTGSIIWSWHDNSEVETDYQICNSAKVPIYTLSANTTFYVEDRNLGEATEYTRYVRAINDNFSSDFLGATANTSATYNKDIDDDGHEEAFSKETQELIDTNGGTSLFFYSLETNRVFFSLNSEIFVWDLDANTKVITQKLDVDGDNSDDYFYQINGSRRYLDVLRGVDRLIGTVSGTVMDQYFNKLQGVDITVITSSETINLVTDTNGAFYSELPITFGDNSTIIANKIGYLMYEKTSKLFNGTSNTETILLKSPSLDVSRDDIHNYPNPFSKLTGTTIIFNVKVASNIKILIYNVKGKMVKKIFEGYKDTGYHQISWNGSVLPRGLYYMIYKTPSSKIMKKVVIK